MKHRQFFILLLTVALLAQAALLSGCSSSEPETPMAVSAEYGYSFGYDSGWEIYPSTAVFSIKTIPGTDGISKASLALRVTEAEGKSAAELHEAFKTSFVSSYSDYSLKHEFTGDDATVLDGKPAVHTEYTATVGNVLYRFSQVTCVNNGLAYSLLFSAADSDFADYSSCLSTVTGSFAFTTPTPSADTSKPVEYNGGKIESLSGDYSFDYSAGWGVIRRDGMTVIGRGDSAATISVSVHSLPSDKEGYAAYDYWTEYVEMLKASLPGFTLTKEFAKEDEPKLGAVVATRKEYSASVNGTDYRYIQVICVYNSYIYSVLFTSDDADYDSLKGELDKVVSAFAFDRSIF